MTIDFICNSFLDFLIETIFRILRNILNRPQILGQFKQLPRWEFSNPKKKTSLILKVMIK